MTWQEVIAWIDNNRMITSKSCLSGWARSWVWFFEGRFGNNQSCWGEKRRRRRKRKSQRQRQIQEPAWLSYRLSHWLNRRGASPFQYAGVTGIQEHWASRVVRLARLVGKPTGTGKWQSSHRQTDRCNNRRVTRKPPSDREWSSYYTTLSSLAGYYTISLSHIFSSAIARYRLNRPSISRALWLLMSVCLCDRRTRSTHGTLPAAGKRETSCGEPEPTWITVNDVINDKPRENEKTAERVV